MSEKNIKYRPYFGLVYKDVKRDYEKWVKPKQKDEERDVLEQEKRDKLARINSLLNSGLEPEKEPVRATGTEKKKEASDPSRELISQIMEFVGKAKRNRETIASYRKKLTEIPGGWERCRDLYWILAVYEGAYGMQSEMGRSDAPDYADILERYLGLFDDKAFPLSKAERSAYRLDLTFMMADRALGDSRGSAQAYRKLASALDGFWVKDWNTVKSGVTAGPMESYVQENGTCLNNRSYLKEALTGAESQARVEARNRSGYESAAADSLAGYADSPKPTASYQYSVAPKPAKKKTGCLPVVIGLIILAMIFQFAVSGGQSHKKQQQSALQTENVEKV